MNKLNMNNLNMNRRSLLTGAAAASAAEALTPFSLATAAAPPVGKQSSGWYRYKVGTHEVTVATDGVTRFRFPDGFVANKSRDEVNAAWVALFQEKDQMAIPYSPIAVNTGSKLIVIDTGTGEHAFHAIGGLLGHFGIVHEVFPFRRRDHDLGIGE